MQMRYFSENLRKYRIMKNLTQENVAEYLNITPQSVSKWERGEAYPDITFLPALANIFETSIDLLIGMDAIRACETRYNIHKKANALQRAGDYSSAEKVYLPAKSRGHIRFAVHVSQANNGSLGILPLDAFCLSGQAFPFVYGSSSPLKKEEARAICSGLSVS